VLRFWREDVRADFNDELAFHIEARVSELVASGMSPETARADALRRIGSLDTLAASCVTIGEATARRRSRTEWMDAMRDDLRGAARQLVRSPAASAASIVTLALGIGANTAVFSVAYAVLLRPLPYRDAERLVAITEMQQSSTTAVGPGQFTEWARRATSFESVSAMTWGTVSMGDAGDPVQVSAAYVTPDYFTTAYLAPIAGRYFTEDEAIPGRNNVAVVSYDAFVNRFGGDPHIQGRVIRLNGRPFTVVGVAPRSYKLRAGDPQVWMPLALTADAKAKFSDHWLAVVAKLKPGVTLTAARADMERVTREIAAMQPAAMVGRSVRVTDLRADLARDYTLQIAVLFGAVSAVLLLACLNVAALSVARLSARRRELAVRAALGAGRARLMRQLITESAFMALLSGALSSVVAYAAIRGIIHIAPSDVPRLGDAGGGLVVVLFAIIVTTLAGVFLGILPAVRMTGGSLEPVLRGGTRASNTDPARDRVRTWLVGGEMALATMLLAGTMLFVRSARSLSLVDPGFDQRGLMSMRISLTTPKYDSAAQLTGAANGVMSRIAALPHVRAVTATSSLPLADGGPDVELHVGGRSYPEGREPYAFIRLVAPNYFAAMRIPMVRGRGFAERDNGTAMRVVVVSEPLARRLWPGKDPVGARISCCGDDKSPTWREVIGVARSVRHRLTDEPVEEIYLPFEQAPAGSWTWSGNTLTLAIRSDGDVISRRALRDAVNGVDPLIASSDVQTVADLRGQSTSATRFALILFSAFALLAVSVATIGVYGVIAYLVNQRSQEIAVRLALGASRRQVFTMILGEGAVLTGLGVVVGVGLASAFSQTLQNLLYGIAPDDPVSYVAVALGLSATALMACYAPARRASNVDPAAALRA
jgi:predicted permease